MPNSHELGSDIARSIGVWPSHVRMHQVRWRTYRVGGHRPILRQSRMVGLRILIIAWRYQGSNPSSAQTRFKVWSVRIRAACSRCAVRMDRELSNPDLHDWSDTGNRVGLL